MEKKYVFFFPGVLNGSTTPSDVRILLARIVEKWDLQRFKTECIRRCWRSTRIRNQLSTSNPCRPVSLSSYPKVPNLGIDTNLWGDSTGKWFRSLSQTISFYHLNVSSIADRLSSKPMSVKCNLYCARLVINTMTGFERLHRAKIEAGFVQRTRFPMAICCCAHGTIPETSLQTWQLFKFYSIKCVLLHCLRDALPSFRTDLWFRGRRYVEEVETCSSKSLFEPSNDLSLSPLTRFACLSSICLIKRKHGEKQSTECVHNKEQIYVSFIMRWKFSLFSSSWFKEEKNSSDRRSLVIHKRQKFEMKYSEYLYGLGYERMKNICHAKEQWAVSSLWWCTHWWSLGLFNDWLTYVKVSSHWGFIAIWLPKTLPFHSLFYWFCLPYHGFL